MKKRRMLILSGITLGMSFAFFTGLNIKKTVKAVNAATEKTFYLDCTEHDYDTYDTICLHLWGSTPGDVYYQANQVGDNYWYVTVPDIDGFAGAEFCKCNRVWPANNGVDNKYGKQSWLAFPSDNFYYKVAYDEDTIDNRNWYNPVAWSLTGSSSAALSSYKFDSDGFQYYATSVTLSTGDVIEFTNGAKTTGFADLRDAGNGQTAKEKGLVEDDGNGKVRVVKGGNYDIYVNCITGKVWMQSDAATDAEHWAQDFIAEGCTDATNGTKAKWGEFETSFNGLTEGAKNLFKGEAHVEYDAVVSGNIKLAVQRYDYVLKKYGRNDANSDQYGYKDFMGRVDAGKLSLAPMGYRTSLGEEIADSNSLIVTFISIALLAVATGYFVIRKRKHNQINN